MKNILITVKFSLTILIIYFLIEFKIINISDIILLTKNYFLTSLVIFILLTIVFLCSYKWWILLKAANYNVPYKMTYCLYSTGLFFNTFMPGSAGGDIIKGVYLFKFVTKSQRTGAVFTIIIDRFIGLHALFSIAFIMFLVAYNSISNIDEIKYFFLFIGLVVFFTLPSLYLVSRFSNNIILNLERKRENKFYSKLLNIFITILKSLNDFNARPISIIYCWIISLVNHILMLTCFYCMTFIINIEILGPLEIFYSGSLSLIANVIPLTPGGIGIGESAFNYFAGSFSGLSSENIVFGSIFFLTFRVLFTLVCMTGAVTFILLKKPSVEYKNI